MYMLAGAVLDGEGEHHSPRSVFRDVFFRHRNGRKVFVSQKTQLGDALCGVRDLADPAENDDTVEVEECAFLIRNAFIDHAEGSLFVAPYRVQLMALQRRVEIQRIVGWVIDEIHRHRIGVVVIT